MDISKPYLLITLPASASYREQWWVSGKRVAKEKPQAWWFLYQLRRLDTSQGAHYQEWYTQGGDAQKRPTRGVQLYKYIKDSVPYDAMDGGSRMNGWLPVSQRALPSGTHKYLTYAEAFAQVL